ncbi:hypothetical protein Ciccas_013776, partial [Cichlidogyrus casuarinus]
VSYYLSVIGQFVNEYPQTSRPVYASLSLVAAAICFIFLPETVGLDLPETIAEADSLRRGSEKEWTRVKRENSVILIDAETKETPILDQETRPL